MKKVKILLTILLTCFYSFSFAQSCNSIHSIQWLLGDWIADDGNNIVIESWKQVSSLTFEGLGESRSKTSNEIQTSESLRLIEMADEIFYLAKVAHNDRPVAFKLTGCSSTSAVFENSTHDFPNKLEYQLDFENKLTVTVSDGKDKGFKINFVRRNNS